MWVGKQPRGHPAAAHNVSLPPLRVFVPPSLRRRLPPAFLPSTFIRALSSFERARAEVEIRFRLVRLLSAFRNEKLSSASVIRRRILTNSIEQIDILFVNVRTNF